MNININTNNINCNNISINNINFDRQKLYNIALPAIQLKGTDNLVPLLTYIKTLDPIKNSSFFIDQSDGIPMKNIIVGFYASQMLFSICQKLQFVDIDTNKDNKISKEELKAAAIKIHGANAINDLVINNLFNIVDEDQTGFISMNELKKIKEENISIHDSKIVAI